MEQFRLFLFFTFLCCFNNNLIAQQGFGIKGGLNIATISAKNDGPYDEFDVNYDPMSSYHGGVYFNIPLTTTVGLRPEVLFSVQGAKTSDDTRLLDLDRIELSYLTIPLLVNVNSGPFTFDIGPAFGYQLDASGNDDKDLDSIYDKDLHLSGILGLNVSLGKLFIGGRFQYGLTNVIKDEITYTDENGSPLGTGDYREKSHLVQIYVGYQIL